MHDVADEESFRWGIDGHQTGHCWCRMNQRTPCFLETVHMFFLI